MGQGLLGYPWKLGTLQSLGFKEEAGAREAFWGRGPSILIMGMWPQFLFSKSKHRKCSITGQEHGMGAEVKPGRGSPGWAQELQSLSLCVLLGKGIKDEPNSPSDLSER